MIVFHLSRGLFIKTNKMANKQRHKGDWITAKDDLLGVFKGVITEITEVAGAYYVKPQGVPFEMVIYEEQIVK